MNAAQIHLALAHLPVIGFLLFTPVFIYGAYRRHGLLIRLSCFVLLILSGIATLVFNTGHGAEEVVESWPGISEEQIHLHEETAVISLWFFALSGCVSALVLALRLNPYKKGVGWVLLACVVLYITTCFSAIYTASQGGMIRHPELIQPVPAPEN